MRKKDTPTLCNTCQLDDVINILISYDPNELIKPECWDGIFHPISLHSSLKHLLSDVKNIKKSLIWLAKYIESKKIDTSKSNNIAKHHEISESVWKLVSAIYNSRQNSLFANKNENSFRWKMSFKYTPNNLLICDIWTLGILLDV